MTDQEYDVIADFAAESTGTVGLPDIVDTDSIESDADQDYAEHAERRDAHLAVDAESDAEPGRGAAPQRQATAVDQQHEAELRAMAEQVTALHQQNVQLQQYLAQQQQAQIPSFEDDPVGHVEAVKQQFANELGQMRQQLHQQQVAAQLHQEMTALAPQVANVEAEFAESVGVENYRAAFDHLDAEVNRRLIAQNPGATPDQLAFAKQNALLAFARQCAQRGDNPAQLVYAKAQELGFNPGHGVPGQQRKAPPTSLSNIPAAGRAPDQRGRLTAKDVAAMSNDEFDALFNSMKRSATPMPF